MLYNVNELVKSYEKDSQANAKRKPTNDLIIDMLLNSGLDSVNVNPTKSLQVANRGEVVEVAIKKVIFDYLELDIANYLEINNEYLLLFYQDQYHNKSYKYIPIDFFINQNKINEYIKDLLSYSNKSIYVYGQNCNLKSINALEKVCGNRVYLIDNSEAFILSLCSKWTMLFKLL